MCTGCRLDGVARARSSSSRVVSPPSSPGSAPLLTLPSIVFIHGLQGGPRSTWTCKVDNSVSADETSSQTIGQSQSAVSFLLASKRNPIRYLSTRKHKPDRRSTPTAEPNKKEVFWPLDHLPDDCANARILTWGYNSRVTEFFGGPSDKSKVSDYARNLLFELSRIREDEVSMGSQESRPYS